MGAAWSSDLAYADSQHWAEERILVQTRAGLPDNDVDAMLQEHNGRVIKRIRPIDLYVVQVPPQAEAAIARALSYHPQIESAEPDRLMELRAVPNDTFYSYSWHLPTIQAPTAWDTTRGDNVTIAVLDTGIEATHPDLNGKLVSGWNTVDNNTDTTDTHGHGTQVAGVAAAATNNGAGVAGVAWGANIMPIRVSTAADGSAYFQRYCRGSDLGCRPWRRGRQRQL